MNEKSVGQLMREYNEKLARFKRMEAWLANASVAEQIHFERAMMQVIHECNEALVAVARCIRVTAQEVEQGFMLNKD